MNKITFLSLYTIFLKIGAILIGGGYVILPILKNELVEKNQLITEQELIDFYTLSQSLPGIVAANISTFIGYKLKGKIGALFSLLGIITIPFLIIILLYCCWHIFLENTYINRSLWEINIAVLILIFLSCKEIFLTTKKNILFYFIFVLGLITIIFFKIPPIEFILIFVILGLLLKIITRRNNK